MPASFSPSERAPEASTSSNPFDDHWTLDSDWTFVNHGSYGACPRAVLEHQSHWRARLEAQPVRFMLREVFDALDRSRERLARFVGGDAERLAFVTNATTGVNTVIESLEWQTGDELLLTDHAYYACRRSLELLAARHHLRLRTVHVPLAATDEEIVAAVEGGCGPKTRLALLDHVTSASARMFPIRSLVATLRERGIWSLVDGAHAPGMVDVNLDAIDADFYVANCHKWLCAPKGAAFLHLGRAGQTGGGWLERIRPLVTSYGPALPSPGRSNFHRSFDWQGTHDPTPFLCVGPAIDHLDGLVDGGWPALRAANHRRICEVRGEVVAALSTFLEQPPLPPDHALGSMAAVALPLPRTEPHDGIDPLYRFVTDRQVEMPIYRWPNDSARWVRLSAQIYNDAADFERATAVLCEGLRGNL